jgi:cobalamin-dependent methionine synthase I
MNEMSARNSTTQVEVEVDKRHVLRRIGYKDDCEPSPRIANLISEYTQLAQKLIKPSYAYVIRNVDMVRQRDAFIGDLITFRSYVIARLLEQCQQVGAFLVTIGDELEKKATRLANEGLILESYTLDAIGSSAVEKIAELMETEISKKVSAQGFCISRRFSPGYCDWSIRQQKELFRMIDGDSVGVSLTTGYLMIPQKSVSGIVGIGPSCADIESYNPCRTCNKRNCLGRR